MIMRQYCSFFIISLFCLSFSHEANAKSHKNKNVKLQSVYFSWGYNKEWYTRSTINIKQDNLNNNYQLVHVIAHDHPGWNDGLTNQAISIPQYNYRLGFFLNEKQDLAFEINFDHTKYVVQDNQLMHMTGTQFDSHIDQPVLFSQATGSYYFLNNGANFLLFNLVKKYNFLDHKNLRLDLLGKAGIGPVIPHVQNSLFGQVNNQGFQFGGWNTGVETAVRATICHYAYLEFAQKADYARYSNLKVYEGTAKQNFGTYELILSLGITLPTKKHNPLFEQKHMALDNTPQAK